MPLLASSPPMLTSIRTSSVLPDFSAASLSRCASLGGVDGIDGVEDLGSLRRLVRLQVADHVEARVLQFGEFREFLGEFLHAVFTEQSLAGGIGLEDRCRGKVLEYGH